MQTIAQNGFQGVEKNGQSKDKLADKPAQLAWSTPAIDVLESDDELLVHADLPGVKPADLDIEFDKDVLTVVGKREAAGVAYKRSFALSRDLDPENIRAELADGVLTLHLPKHASRRARTIQVKAG
jgi:HSP20 family molecular chaperone IbpA